MGTSMAWPRGPSYKRVVGTRLALLWLPIAALTLPMCGDDDPPPPTASTTSSSSTGGGGCPMGPPEALYEIVVVTDAGDPLPGDTTVAVRWSAGDEPVFVLDDASTHKTLEDGSNVVCDVTAGQGGAGGTTAQGGAGGAPGLTSLRCELWTSGTTEVTVTATGYEELVENLKPETIDGCEMPVPSEVELALSVDLMGQN